MTKSTHSNMQHFDTIASITIRYVNTRAETNTTFVYSNIHMSKTNEQSNSWGDMYFGTMMVCALHKYW